MHVWQQNRGMDYLRRRAENMITKANGPIAQSSASYGHRPPANEAHKLEMQDDVSNNPLLWDVSGGTDQKS